MLGGGFEGGEARFGLRSVKIPARRVTEAVERLLRMYAAEKSGAETAGEFFRRIDPKRVEERLADLVALSEKSARPEDLIDLGEAHAFKVEAMEGECAA
jgi:hypothetical protein